MCGSVVDIQSPTAEIRRGNKKRRRNHRMKIYTVNHKKRGSLFLTITLA